MTIDLSPELQELVRKRAVQSGLDENSLVAEILRDVLERGQQRESERKTPTSGRGEQIPPDVPPEERQELDNRPGHLAAERSERSIPPKKYSKQQLSPTERVRLWRELMDEIDRDPVTTAPPLSDEDLSRESIYDDERHRI